VEIDRFPSEDVEVWSASEDERGLPLLEGWAVTYRDTPNFSGRIVVPGAFRDSLKKRPSAKKPLPMGYEHSSFTGTQVIGGWRQARDDPDQGVFLSEGRVSDTTQGRDAAVLVRDGVINGLSIGFRPSAVKIGRPGETHEFKTPFGKRSYEVSEDSEESVVFVTKGELLETSVVSTPADDDARLTKIQSLADTAVRAMPGLQSEASWEDVAYSMAVLMGGKGAGTFSDLPELERVAMYQRLASRYAAEGKTPPPYEPTPDFHLVPFQHGERDLFARRYVAKQLAAAVAGIRGLSGPLSREGCAMALQLGREIAAKVDGPLSVEQREHVTVIAESLRPHLAPRPDKHALAAELRSAVALTKGEGA
jgi:HK97 family phage prohead protease